MADIEAEGRHSPHAHVFLGEGHERAERRTWAVIWLCGAMMALEIFGGLAFGSIALVADGLHMSTHAGALLLAALAYSYARRHADDARFSFGTGKFGDLAGFTSAIVLAMIALLIGYESVARVFAPVPIRFSEALPIACLGLLVNIGSVRLLSGGGHHHGHDHGHDHGRGGAHGHAEGDGHAVQTDAGSVMLSIFEDGVPPRFRLDLPPGAAEGSWTVETVRLDGARRAFAMSGRGDRLESIDEVPEPHAFAAHVRLGDERVGPAVLFEEHAHGDARSSRDNNMRAAVVHVIADAAVSVLVIVGLLLARAFGWLWMDPAAGVVGACVIASWAYGLVRDTGAILLDMNPDRSMAQSLRAAIEQDGDRLTDLHLWRLGPGHLGAILCVATDSDRDASAFRRRLARFRALSHVTIEIEQTATPRLAA